ncbi:MAG: hypothetical protein ACOCXA_07260, partial [Planctomycetota bacterium]
FDPEYIRLLEHCSKLKALDLTPSFGVQGSILPELPAMPELRWLSVDCAASEASVIDFIAGSPKLEALRLHRTGMSDAELTRLVTVLPELRWLEYKCSRKQSEHATSKEQANDPTLAVLAQLPKLEMLYLSGGFQPPHSWENGFEHLASMSQLRVLTVKESRKANDPALDQLRAARPDLQINPDSFIGLTNPVAYDWDISPSKFRVGDPPTE